MLGISTAWLLLVWKDPALCKEKGSSQSRRPSHQPAHAAGLGHTRCGSYSLACLGLFRKGWVYFCLLLPQDFWHQIPLPMPK